MGLLKIFSEQHLADFLAYPSENPGYRYGIQTDTPGPGPSPGFVFNCNKSCDAREVQEDEEQEGVADEDGMATGLFLT